MANSRLCSIPDCGKPYLAKGYCRSHYKRLKRHGHALAGSTSTGDPMRFIEEVALRHTGNECVNWPYGKKETGYACVWLDGQMRSASRYVCELVNGPPPTPEHQAAHSCGKGHEACIAPNHLSWKTPEGNNADKYLHGTANLGERNGQSKITEQQAREIISLKGSMTQKEIGNRFGIARSTVREIHAGLIWSWLRNPQGTIG